MALLHSAFGPDTDIDPTIFQFCPCNLHPEPFTFDILRVIQTRASEGLFVVMH